MKTLFIIWQDNKTRAWHPVGQLTKSNGLYEFAYTKGALVSADFKPFGRLSDLHKKYQSDVLFPLFANRLLPKSRPEYESYVQWIGFKPGEEDPLEMLALTGGIRQTDPLTIYSPPQEEDGQYKLSFFCHGIRHLAEDCWAAVSLLKENDPLYLMRDVQNEFDADAVAIRTDSPCRFIGYVPRYLAHDVTKLLSEHLANSRPKLRVQQINPDAPLQFRVLCQLTATWPKDFQTCGGEEFELIGEEMIRKVAG